MSIQIKENILLANHTTFRIGGEARYFVEVKSPEEIKEAVLWAREKNVPYFVLGGGSNLLVSDEGFGGLVIKLKNETLRLSSPESGGVRSGDKLIVEAEAGVPLIKVIMETVKNGYSGLEWGFGIPGTLGGAICGNAGRLGQDISPVVESVSVFDGDGKEKTLSHNDCGFSYRQSIFKKNNWIILGATLVFEKKAQNLIDEVLAKAKKVVSEHPPFPSAGCVFKNIQVTDLTQISDRYYTDYTDEKTEIPSEKIRGGKLGAGYLIDQCGLKGKQIGGVKIWEGHANYIINVAGAKAADILALINICKEKVKEKYNIELEEEIRYLGF